MMYIWNHKQLFFVANTSRNSALWWNPSVLWRTVW